MKQEATAELWTEDRRHLPYGLERWLWVKYVNWSTSGQGGSREKGKVWGRSPSGYCSNPDQRWQQPYKVIRTWSDSMCILMVELTDFAGRCGIWGGEKRFQEQLQDFWPVPLKTQRYHLLRRGPGGRGGLDKSNLRTPRFSGLKREAEYIDLPLTVQLLPDNPSLSRKRTEHLTFQTPQLSLAYLNVLRTLTLACSWAK